MAYGTLSSTKSSPYSAYKMRNASFSLSILHEKHRSRTECQTKETAGKEKAEKRKKRTRRKLHHDFVVLSLIYCSLLRPSKKDEGKKCMHAPVFQYSAAKHKTEQQTTTNINMERTKCKEDYRPTKKPFRSLRHACSFLLVIQISYATRSSQINSPM